MRTDAMLEAVATLAGGLNPDLRSKLEDFGRLLREAGGRRNLMSPKALECLEEHIVDAAALLRILDPEGGELADLGSGAGLPGVVLAILRPLTSVALIDSRRSKVVFLRQAVRRLELDNAAVLHERLDALAGRVSFPIAVSRALGSIGGTLASSLALVAPGGRLVLYKGPAWERERAAAEVIAAAAGAVLVCEERVELPGLGRCTTFATFRRRG